MRPGCQCIHQPLESFKWANLIDLIGVSQARVTMLRARRGLTARLKSFKEHIGNVSTHPLQPSPKRAQNVVVGASEVAVGQTEADLTLVPDGLGGKHHPITSVFI